MACMNVSTKIQNVVVCILFSLNVSIIICYESKVWLFVLYEKFWCHLKKVVVSVVQCIGIFFSYNKKNQLLVLRPRC